MSVSIISNIAEGYKRVHLKDKMRFYNHSQASIKEVKCQLLLAFDLDYLPECKFKELDELANRASKILYGWMESQK